MMQHGCNPCLKPVHEAALSCFATASRCCAVRNSADSSSHNLTPRCCTRCLQALWCERRFCPSTRGGGFPAAAPAAAGALQLRGTARARGTAGQPVHPGREEGPAHAAPPGPGQGNDGGLAVTGGGAAEGGLLLAGSARLAQQLPTPMHWPLSHYRLCAAPVTACR